MHPGDPDPGLVPVAAALLLADRACCALRSFCSARRRNLGLATFRPSDRTAKCVRPRSIPISVPASGSGSGLGLHDEAREVPASSVHDHRHARRADGRSRDQRTVTSPIFGSRSFPPGVMANQALRVNRIACRPSLRDRNRGGAIFGPLRLPGDRGEEVPVRRVQVRERLLEHHGRHLGKPCPLRGALHLGQPGRQLRVGNVRQPGRVRILPGA